jgi:phosphatidylglycerophosphate synthase
VDGYTDVVGILVVVPPDEGHRRTISPAHVVAGLPLARRIVLAATAAGYTEVWLDGRAATARPGRDRPPHVPVRIVVLPANVIPQPTWLRSLLEAPADGDRLFVDASMTTIVDTADPSHVIEAAARAPGVSALIAELRAKYAESTWPFPGDGCFALGAPDDIPRAETWLLRSLIKQREGFMSRHFERRISLALTRRLVGTAITPNAMTMVSAAIGLASAPFFLSAAPGWQLTGALLFLAHSILDGCDGEIARLKFLQSRRGAALDFWSDNVVHVAVFTCIGLGWARASASPWPLVAAAIAVVATLGAASVMFRRTADDRATAGGSSSARLLDALASRDFIYVLIVLSAFGKAAWFLGTVAIGTPVFLAFALWLAHRHGRVRCRTPPRPGPIRSGDRHRRGAVRAPRASRVERRREAGVRYARLVPRVVTGRARSGDGDRDADHLARRGGYRAGR